MEIAVFTLLALFIALSAVMLYREFSRVNGRVEKLEEKSEAKSKAIHEMDKFWIVMRDKSETYVVKRHVTEEEAKAEAERLCRKENARFFILEVTAYVEPKDMPVAWQEVK